MSEAGWDDYAPAHPVDDDGLRLAEQQVIDLEEEAGVELAKEDFDRVTDLVQGGADAKTAFNLVVREAAENEAAWELDFDAGVEKLEAEIGRRITSDERKS